MICSPEFEHHSSFTGESIYMKLHRGELDIEPLVAAYEETLKLTLPDVQKVLDGSTGRCVVYSDHRNLFR